MRNSRHLSQRIWRAGVAKPRIGNVAVFCPAILSMVSVIRGPAGSVTAMLAA